MRVLFFVLAAMVSSVVFGQGNYNQNINFKRQMRADTATLQLVMLPNLSLPTARAYPLLRDTATGKIYKDTCGYWSKCDTFPYLPLAGGTMDSGALIYFGIGGQNISQGTFDNGTGGNRGISLNCAIGYELNWQGGHLSSSYNSGADSIPVLIDSGLHVNGDGVNPTAVFDVNGVEAMRVDTNGNVGIGTAAPAGKLHVVGNNVDPAAIFMDGNVGIGTATPYSDNMLQVNGNIFFENATYPDALLRIIESQGQVLIGDFANTVNGTNIYINDSLRIISVNNALEFQSNAAISQINGSLRVSNVGDVRIEGIDSITIYALTPAEGTFQFCTDCTGNGITGRLLGYIGAAWRRFTIE